MSDKEIKEKVLAKEEHYQLYKLLAFAIQELSFYASEDEMKCVLSLPLPERILSNRAQLAVDRIEKQNPHFLSGYIKHRRGNPYPPMDEIKKLRNCLETVRSNIADNYEQRLITEVLQDAQEWPCTCGNCDGEHFGMAIKGDELV